MKASSSKAEEGLTEVNAKLGQIKELFDIQEKYKTSIVSCIENEIYGHVEAGITKKIIGRVDNKINSLNSSFV